MWEPQRKTLEPFCELRTPDMPGFGTAPLARAVSNADMAAGIAEDLERAGIHEPVVIAGLSMGGYVTLEFVRQFPGKVRALGLFATRAGADAPEQKAKREEQVRFIELKGVAPMAEAMLPKLLGKTTLESRPETVRNVSRLMADNRADGMINALRAMAGRKDLAGLLSGIDKPALVIAGEEDQVIPRQETDRMAQTIPNAEYHVLPKSGHLLNLEMPDEFNALLRRFIERLKA